MTARSENSDKSFAAAPHSAGRTRATNRIAVAGAPGAGKSTLCRLIHDIGGHPYTELDSLYHGPSWTQRPEFLADVHAMLAQPRWVTEWQYSAVKPAIAEAADVILWLDFPYWTVTFPQVVKRTLVRGWKRQPLWNGNVEPALHTILTDKDHIIRWSIKSRNKFAKQLPPYADKVVRLRSHREVEEWVRRELA